MHALGDFYLVCVSPFADHRDLYDVLGGGDGLCGRGEILDNAVDGGLWTGVMHVTPSLHIARGNAKKTYVSKKRELQIEQ